MNKRTTSGVSSHLRGVLEVSPGLYVKVGGIARPFSKDALRPSFKPSSNEEACSPFTCRSFYIYIIARTSFREKKQNTCYFFLQRESSTILQQQRYDVHNIEDFVGSVTSQPSKHSGVDVCFISE